MENVDPQPMDLVEPTKPPAPPAAQPETAAPESAKAPEAAKEPEEPAKTEPAKEEPAAEPAAAEEPAKVPAKADEEDEEDEEDEAPKPGLYNGSQIVEGKRARKSTERIAIEAPQKKEKKVGAGTPLGEMPEVDELMREAKNKDALEDLHRVVFKTKGAKGKVRKNLAAFAGFVYEDEAKEKPRLLDRLAKFKNGQITAMLDLCRVDRSAKSFEGKVDKEKLIGRLVEFLEKPSSSLQKAAPKRKRAPAKKKAVPKKADSDDEDDDDDDEVMPVSKRPRKKAAPPPPRRAPKRAAPKAKKVDATFGTDPATETYGLENLGESQPMPLSIPVRLFAAVARAELVKDASLDRKALMAKVEATAGCAMKCGEFKAVCRLLAERAALEPVQVPGLPELSLLAPWRR